MALSHHVRQLLLGHIQYIHVIIQVVRLVGLGCLVSDLSMVPGAKWLATEFKLRECLEN